jgi:transmembrane sensor
VDPAGAKLHLPAGTRLDADDGQKLLRAVRADPITVGAWRSGDLPYTGEPLGNVVDDLSRASGIAFRLEPTIAQRRFTGTLSISAIKEEPRSLEPLLGVKMTRDASGWTLGGPPS